MMIDVKREGFLNFILVSHFTNAMVFKLVVNYLWLVRKYKKNALYNTTISSGLA